MDSSSSYNAISSLIKEDLQKLCNESNSYCDILRKLNCFDGGNNVNRLKSKIKELDIDINLLDGNRKKMYKEKNKEGVKKIEVSNEDVFKKGNFNRTYTVKRKVIKFNLIEYKCYKCGNKGEWNNISLTLILDHIDGDNTNNELSNLRFVCPNCDSQSDTYKGRNVKWIKRKCLDCGKILYRKGKTGYCKECIKNHNELTEHVKYRRLNEDQIKYILDHEIESNVSLSKKFNVSDNTIKKIKKNKGYLGN